MPGANRRRIGAGEAADRAARLERPLAASPDDPYRVDVEGRYLYADPDGARNVGRSPDRMIGGTWREHEDVDVAVLVRTTARESEVGGQRRGSRLRSRVADVRADGDPPGRGAITVAGDVGERSAFALRLPRNQRPLRDARRAGRTGRTPGQPGGRDA